MTSLNDPYFGTTTCSKCGRPIRWVPKGDGIHAVAYCPCSRDTGAVAETDVDLATKPPHAHGEGHKIQGDDELKATDAGAPDVAPVGRKHHKEVEK